MTIPEIKKYLGGGVRVRHFTLQRVKLKLKEFEKIPVSIFIPSQCHELPYVAFLDDRSGRLLLLLVVEKLVTPERLDNLLRDISQPEDSLDCQFK